jgi:peptidoglycan/LPS O-acetylase OafA/YrhL
LKRLSWIPAHPLSTFAAEASYGVYLIHVPILIVLIRLLTSAGPFAEASTLHRFLVCLGVVIPTVYLLAFLAHKYIEMPGIGWGRRIVKRVR